MVPKISFRRSLRPTLPDRPRSETLRRGAGRLLLEELEQRVLLSGFEYILDDELAPRRQALDPATGQISDPAQEPIIVDFGGAPAEAPVAGLDQWEALHGGVVTAAAPPVTGAQRVMVLRVYFNDYAATSRYTQAEVQGLFANLDQLFQDTSYGNMSIDYQVSSLFQLPDNRSAYVDDVSNGDVSNGGKFNKVLLDAIDNSPTGEGLDWSNLASILVVMAETDSSQFYRGAQADRNLPQGPGGSVELTPAAVFSENPSENDNQVWGRWAHEIGHAFQQDGPPHPSNYNNEFELLDSNYPGQTGVFEKQDDIAFPGWLPTSKYQEFDPASGGGTANIYAMEYDPTTLPNIQAVKAKLTDDLYYLISVRRQILGDDTNGDFTPFGIPDEGVLIERVSEGSDPWVTVKGPGGNRNKLWQEGDTFTDLTDGIQIAITQKIDPSGDPLLGPRGVQPGQLIPARRRHGTLDFAAGEHLGDDRYLDRQPSQRLRDLPLRDVERLERKPGTGGQWRRSGRGAGKPGVCAGEEHRHSHRDRCEGQLRDHRPARSRHRWLQRICLIRQHG